MIKKLNEILTDARANFNRASTHRWFVVIIIALMVGQEHMGVTSIIRELCLEPSYYDSLLHFFRSTAFTHGELTKWWIQTVIKAGVVCRENGMPVLVGDGTKKSKEGRKMPCVKRLHQESEDSSKAAYIFGHMFGLIGVLAGGTKKLFCIPLSMKIHDGDKEILKWDAEPENVNRESHVVRIIRDASQAAYQLGKSLLLLDAYYLSVPALLALKEASMECGRELLSVVVRAKSNAAAYENPTRKPGRGRPPVKGSSVKLMNLWHNSETRRTQTTVMMYGKEKSVSFITCDLLWGKTLYQRLRFVIAQISGSKPIILACTDLTLSPEQILRLYSYRFKIECCFFNLKHTIAGFAYRFWSAAVPKLNRFAKAGTDVLEGVSDSHDKKRIAAAFRATQSYMMLACIAMGLLQICSLLFADEMNVSPVRWLRTKTNTTPSEASTAAYMRKVIFKHFGSDSDLYIIRLIRCLQRHSQAERDSGVA